MFWGESMYCKYLYVNTYSTANIFQAESDLNTFLFLWLIHVITRNFQGFLNLNAVIHHCCYLIFSRVNPAICYGYSMLQLVTWDFPVGYLCKYKNCKYVNFNGKIREKTWAKSEISFCEIKKFLKKFLAIPIYSHLYGGMIHCRADSSLHVDTISEIQDIFDKGQNLPE